MIRKRAAIKVRNQSGFRVGSAHTVMPTKIRTATSTLMDWGIAIPVPVPVLTPGGGIGSNNNGTLPGYDSNGVLTGEGGVYGSSSDDTYEDDYSTQYSIETELENIVQDLREGTSISVPNPPKKRGKFVCIARVQDLNRSTGNCPVIGWGWGVSSYFQTAKNDAVQRANASIGAVDTHHAQWRCIDPKGNIIRP